MPRADAQRNRDLILTAAKKVFTERGPSAPLDDIARRAGVGNATLYRHFPTRRDLLVAVYSDEVTDLTTQGRDLLRQDPPADALFTWLRAFITHVADKADLARAIPEDGRSPLFDQWHAAMHTALAPLLARAQETGAVRPDLDGRDLLALAGGIATAGSGAAQTDRLLRLVREGIATPAQTPN
ncbi:TetR/AcrR family transcriptional regulator [Actinomadura verrucosospora]|uniref:TetR family transcriptional regulator n=1 Tax=Actinomadura verrucosospora TaxID=46165 RepID=A0A7D3VTB2_ACTVE|nr:TetR/AcrR family transcriptional regulator [Actinomadura verrucosospora]QKG22715.1 TetR family transcriptional regulator [Actinomadura verrucosospora]